MFGPTEYEEQVRHASPRYQEHTRYHRDGCDHGHTLLASNGYTTLPVVDADERLIGVVTEADVVRDRFPRDPRYYCTDEVAFSAVTFWEPTMHRGYRRSPSGR